MATGCGFDSIYCRTLTLVVSGFLRKMFLKCAIAALFKFSVLKFHEPDMNCWLHISNHQQKSGLHEVSAVIAVYDAT